MVDAEIAYCPFCGCTKTTYDESTERDQYGNYYTSRFVWCPYPYGGCGARIFGSSKRQAISLWNRRVIKN